MVAYDCSFFDKNTRRKVIEKKVYFDTIVILFSIL